MPEPGFWVLDPDTEEQRFITYQELEDDTATTFIRPIGGFIFEAGLFSLAQLSHVPFYVQDWLPKQGRSLVYAPAKTGKSYLCLQLARCVGCSEPFLGLSTAKGKVLYIQFELGEEILQQRLRQTGKEYPNVYVGTSFSLKIDSPVGQRRLWTAVEAVEPDVLILDPWYKAILGDENESQDMRKATDFLDTLIEGFHCSTVVIHHAGKDPSKRGRGSTVLEDWVDSYISMTRTSKRGEPLRVKLEPIFLRHASLPADPIEAELGPDFEFHLLAPAQTVKNQVAEVIAASSVPLSPKELFALNFGKNTAVYEALRELMAEGKIEKEGRGKYQWKEA